MKIRELFVRLGVKADKDKVDDFDDAIEGLKGNLADLVGWLAKVTAGIAGVLGAAGMVTQQTAEYGEEVLRNSRAMSMTVERYQELQFGMNQLGASTDDFMDALSTLTDRANDAANGSKTYIDEFERIGIAVDELKGMSPGQIFERYVDAAVQAEDRTEAVTSAVRLLGDDLGRRIMPALTSSAESFEDFSRMANEAGIVLTESQIVAAREAQHEWRFLKAAVVGFKRYLGMQLMPMFSRLLGKKGFKGWFAANARIMKSGIDRFAKFLGEEIEKIATFVADLNKRVGGAQGWIDLLRSGYHILSNAVMIITGGKVAAVIASIAASLKTGGVAALALYGKVLLVAVVVAAMLLLWEDIWVWMKGGESVAGEIAKRFGKGNTELDRMVRTSEAGKDAWEKWGDVVIEFFDIVSDLMVALMMFIWNMIKLTASALAEAVTGILRLLTEVGTLIENLFATDDWVQALSDFNSEASDIIEETLEGIANAILRYGANTARWMKGLLGDGYDWLIDKTSEFFLWVEESLKSISDALGGIFDPSEYMDVEVNFEKRMGEIGLGGLVPDFAKEAVMPTSNSNSNSTTTQNNRQNIGDMHINVYGDGNKSNAELAREGYDEFWTDHVKNADAALTGGER